MDLNIGEGALFYILQDSFHVLQHEMTRFGNGKCLSITMDAPVLMEISHWESKWTSGADPHVILTRL
jgi:hypothetical protein